MRYLLVFELVLLALQFSDLLAVRALCSFLAFSEVVKDDVHQRVSRVLLRLLRVLGCEVVSDHVSLFDFCVNLLR